MITGDKSAVRKSSLDRIKKFGLMHILTPSGLHLSSLLLVFKFFPRLKFAVTLSLFAAGFFVPGFLALKRMLIFYIVNFFAKNITLSFVLTMILSYLIGNYHESPVSFCFTFIFWGSIIFHRGNKLLLVIKLFLFQAVISFLFKQELHLAALFVNPLATTVFTMLFPLMLFAYPLSSTRFIGERICEGLDRFLAIIETVDFLNVKGEVAVLVGMALLYRYRTFLVIILILLSPKLNPQRALEHKYQAVVYPLATPIEVLNVTKRKVDFIDRRCRFDFHGDYRCIKKPSKYGGPSI